MYNKSYFTLCQVSLSSLLLAATIGCGGNSGGGGGGGGGGTPEGDPLLLGITQEHNKARASVDPPASTPIPDLTWSDSVAAAAQDWANNCQFEHGPPGLNFGQNIAADTGQGTAVSVVADWVGEKVDYDYATDSCSRTCGHYTQVVWADSLHLGCGVKTCTQNSPFGSFNGGVWQFWVCNYDPPGNFIGQRPY